MRKTVKFCCIALTTMSLAVHCTSKNENRPLAMEQDSAAKQQAAPKKTISEAAKSRQPERRKNLLEGASVAVLGLKLPNGMVPISGSRRIYRFEGIQPVEQVADFIRVQIDDAKESKEFNGYLFRAAKVKNPLPASSSPAGQRLAIRVSREKSAKTTVAVWIDDSADDSRRLGGTHAKSARPSRNENSPLSKHRERIRRDTLRVSNKIARGEELTKEDLNSPYFE